VKNSVRGARRGNVLLELALGFAALWAVFSGVFQFGYAIYIYHSLVNTVTSGAYYAGRAEFNADSTADFSDQVKNMVVYGSPAGGSSPLVPQLTTAKVNVAWTTDASGVPQSVTVSIVDYSVSAVVGGVVFNNKPRCTVRFAGLYVTSP